MTIIDKLYINGTWQTPIQASEYIEVLNPATEETCAKVIKADGEDVEQALFAAKAAFPTWSSTSSEERARWMNAIADEMQDRYQDLVDAHVMTMGCPRHMTGEFHVDAAIEGMRYYAELAGKMDEVEERGDVLVLKEAVGVCTFINPWNYPLHQLVGKLAPALAAGCTVVEKPAEQTPLPDLVMAEICHTVGLPAGVFNLVFGSGREIGPVLSSHPIVDMVSFTGSTAAGIQVATAAAPSVKRVCQELGGKSALIVTEDSDLAAAVRYGVEDVMGNTGQTCNALTRMYLPKNRYDEAVKIAQEVVQEQVVGDPLQDSTTMGPLASRRQQQTVLEYIQKGLNEGARLVSGGMAMPEGLECGAYVQPTIFADVTQNMAIAREEIFGPVLCLLAYEDIDQAVELANDSVYGLSSGVYAKDKAGAIAIARRLKAGQCYIQGSYFNLQAPFGGVKQSGNGREWGTEAMHEYIETKAIICG